MLLTVWILCVLISIGLTVITLLVRTDFLALTAGTLSFVMWLLVAYGALDLTRITNTGDRIDHSEPSLAILAGGMALLPVLLVVAAGLINAFRS